MEEGAGFGGEREGGHIEEEGRLNQAQTGAGKSPKGRFASGAVEEAAQGEEKLPEGGGRGSRRGRRSRPRNGAQEEEGRREEKERREEFFRARERTLKRPKKKGRVIFGFFFLLNFDNCFCCLIIFSPCSKISKIEAFFLDHRNLTKFYQFNFFQKFSF